MSKTKAVATAPCSDCDRMFDRDTLRVNDSGHRVCFMGGQNSRNPAAVVFKRWREALAAFDGALREKVPDYDPCGDAERWKNGNVNRAADELLAAWQDVGRIVGNPAASGYTETAFNAMSPDLRAEKEEGK